MADFELKKIAPQPGDPPFSTHLWIYLNAFSTDEDGYVLVTSSMVSREEVDFEIDRLIENMNQLRQKAKTLL